MPFPADNLSTPIFQETIFQETVSIIHSTTETTQTANSQDLSSMIPQEILLALAANETFPKKNENIVFDSIIYNNDVNNNDVNNNDVNNNDVNNNSNNNSNNNTSNTNNNVNNNTDNNNMIRKIATAEDSEYQAYDDGSIMYRQASTMDGLPPFLDFTVKNSNLVINK